ncbi:MAG: hypothetical protein JWL66_1187 [Sphingomonadales bacterium]|nr:hypothetical protein [Sphingomonadales bacterium]
MRPTIKGSDASTSTLQRASGAAWPASAHGDGIPDSGVGSDKKIVGRGGTVIAGPGDTMMTMITDPPLIGLSRPATDKWRSDVYDF